MVRTVWIPRTGAAPYVQRHLPTGGVEIHFPIGGQPQLVGPLTGPEIPTADLPHLIVAFKKAVEPLTTHGLQGSGVQPVVLRIGTIWGPLVDPETPFFYIPPYISAVLRGEQPQPLYADDGGDVCYAPDAGRAIALLMTAKTLPHNTYNVSSGQPFTNRDFAEALLTITPGLRLDLLPGRQGGPGDGSGTDPYLDITRLTHDTGFKPAFDVADYVAWRADNPR